LEGADFKGLPQQQEGMCGKWLYYWFSRLLEEVVRLLQETTLQGGQVRPLVAPNEKSSSVSIDQEALSIGQQPATARPTGV
jgi:hypothetical protein